MMCLAMGRGHPMISDLMRPVWTWPLWSWRRLILTACVLCVLVTAVIRAAQAPASHHPASAHHASSTGGLRRASALSQSALTAATRDGQDFATAWVSRRPGWDTRLRRYATPTLAAQVTAGGHGYLPATGVTGRATLIRKTAGSVTVSVPTNAGPAVITVILAGGKWLADSVHLARVGD
jgi:hypothetical protein